MSHEWSYVFPIRPPSYLCRPYRGWRCVLASCPMPHGMGYALRAAAAALAKAMLSG